MTISRKLTSITTAIAIAVASFGPLATSASAGGYRDGDGYTAAGTTRATTTAAIAATTATAAAATATTPATTGSATTPASTSPSVSAP